MYSCNFVIISRCKKRYHLSSWTNVNSLHSGMLFAKFGWNCSNSSGKEYFLTFVNEFLQFRYYLLVEMCEGLNLNEHDSSSAEGDFCHVWLKLAQWFRRRGFLKFVNVNWIPFTQGHFVLSLVEMGPVVLDKMSFANMSIHFRNIVIFSPWKRTWPFVWTNLNSLYARMISTSSISSNVILEC